MSIIQAVSGLNVYGSTQAQNRKAPEQNNSRNAAEEAKSSKVKGDRQDTKAGDPVPTSAIHPDFQDCGPLNVLDGDRRYTTDPTFLNTLTTYHVWVKEKLSPPDEYVIGTRHTPLPNRIIDLDLGTKGVNLSGVGYYNPGDPECDGLIEEMLINIYNIEYYNNSIGPYSIVYVSDKLNNDRNDITMAYDFLLCVKNLPTDVEETSKDAINGVKVYPNPGKSEVTIQLPQTATEDVKISIFNMLGQKVEELTISKGESAVEWNVKDDNISSGVYIYQIKAGSEVVNGKIQVLK